MTDLVRLEHIIVTKIFWILDLVQLLIIAIGGKGPAWVQEGFEEYARRLRRPWVLDLKEITGERRGRNANIRELVRAEGEHLLAAVPTGWRVVALDPNGRRFDSSTLAQHLARWSDSGGHMALLIGGPDGLSTEVLKSVDEVWSVSEFTLAHQVVRIVMAEQLYRAFSIINRLPYHRGIH